MVKPYYNKSITNSHFNSTQQRKGDILYVAIMGIKNSVDWIQTNGRRCIFFFLFEFFPLTFDRIEIEGKEEEIQLAANRIEQRLTWKIQMDVTMFVMKLG